MIKTSRFSQSDPYGTAISPLAVLALASALSACGGDTPAPPQEATVPEPTRPEVVAADARVELVQEGFEFTEGPVAGPDGSIYFSDVRASRIHRLLPDGTTVEVFREDTNRANGLAFDRQGTLIAAEGGGRIVAIESAGKLAVLAEGPGAVTYAPNDLILNGQGGIYFTDPGPRPAPGEEPARKPRVFYMKPGGETVLITDAVGRPNGITLTLDGRTLLVADSNGQDIMALDVRADGTATNLRPWARLHDIPPGENSSADGLAIDADGRLYVATLVGIQVFSPTGEYLETIETPKQPSNMAFGGPDRKTLYITAREGLYRLSMATAGPADRAK